MEEIKTMMLQLYDEKDITSLLPAPLLGASDWWVL
jgi:hypothetical protein